MYYLAEAFPFVRKIRIPFDRDQVMLLMVAINQLFLGLDIFLAHSNDGIIKPYEWIPVAFGPIAGISLLIAGVVSLRHRTLANLLASLIFFFSILVGLLGTYFHLHRSLLPFAPAGEQLTTGLLVWGPPLLCPITYILIGMIGLSAAWSETQLDSGKISLFGGRVIQMPTNKTQIYFILVGIFMLVTVLSSVLDHARVRFENPWLWLPTIVGVFASVVTVSMGFFPKLRRPDVYIFLCAMLLMGIVGMIGLWLHIERNLAGQGALLLERFLRGAPVMAPLLFANMALLGGVILLDPNPPVPRKKA